ncbi:MAG: succinyl-diaminopimelate desuccinylase, partial [Defluviimonas sp.]|nr:succinyl-diaminopimelate desuccinylase [Defluviimonas sp.]
MPVDPVALTAGLIRCPSVTPMEGGALHLLERVLTGAGFACTRVDRNGVPNLFARWGAKGAARSFGFNGHTDVVPAGDAGAWTRDPFGGEIVGGEIWGRGATDMKSGVAAFAAAACDFVRQTPPDGAVILTITGDEEGPGKDGTVALLDWMAAEGEAMSVCLVGEPTCPEVLGEMMKIGRRGSMTAFFTVLGVQGHSAYPQRARNPLHALVSLLGRLTAKPLDEGTAHFDASTLQVTTVDCGNPASNVIPARATAAVNIRFNDAHSSASLTARLRAEADRVAAETGVTVQMRVEVSGESFLTPPGAFVDLVAAAVQAETGVRPALSTSGGTSDARFVK